MKRVGVILCLFCCIPLWAAEVIPPKPPKYFNDFAGVVPAAKADQFNEQLASFERDTSNQIVVAVFPTLQTDSSLEDYANRVFRAWGVGQKGRNNGAVLFVFIGDRRMRIEVGYGLEGVLPDAICKRIIADEMTPRFRQRDYAGGLGAAINAMIAATRGEYKGRGRTVAEQQGNQLIGFIRDNPGAAAWILLIALGILQGLLRRARGTVYNRRGYRRSGWSGWDWGSGGSTWGSGSGGGWGDGGGGGFSGGGGSSGGGGASGSW